MLRKFLAFWMILTFSLNGQAQIITSQKEAYSVNGYIQIFRENGQPIPVSAVVGNYYQRKFKPVKTRDNSLNLGYAKSVYWVAIPVENRTSDVLNLESGIAKSGIFNIEHYNIDPQGGKIISWPKTGANFDVKSRTIESRFYYFPVILKPGQHALLLYRIDQRGSNLHAPFRLLNSDFRRATEFKINLVYAFFCGLILFASFFSLITYLWFNDRIYLYYSLYTFFSCLFILSDSNLASMWLYPNWHSWNSISTSMYGGWLAVFRLSFTNDFLHLKESRKKLFRFIQVWIVLMLVLTLLIPLVFTNNEYMALRPWVYSFGVVCFLGEWAIHAYAIGTMIRHRYKPAYLYGLSIFSVFIISMIYNVKSLNLAYVKELPYYYFPAGLTLDIIILSFALVYKFNFHRKKHSELQLNFQKEILKTQLEIQEQTFQNISQDIHDNIGQVLSLAKLTINTIDPSKPAQAEEKVHESSDLLTQAIKDLRELSHLLNTGFINETGLVKALGQQLSALQKTKLYTTKLNLTGKEIPYDPQKELVLFRIVQELLNNIVKHARATHITVEIDFKPRLLRIEITDNGKGFDPSLLSKNGHCGIGLSNIQNRIDLIKGTCSIHSKPGHGTSVAITLPAEN